MYRQWLLLFFFLCFLVKSQAQVETGEYLMKTYQKGDLSLNYRIMYPRNFTEEGSYPLVVFLHGAGERGTDNRKQLTHGSKLFKDSLDAYPAIVIFPQCPPTDYWANLSRPDQGGSSRVFTFHTDGSYHPALKLVAELIDEELAKPYVDKSRFYLSGLSMGAMGVWELLWKIPEKIAAAAPICGAGPRDKASSMTDVPVWAFHGVKDDVVHYRYSVNMVKGVQKAGGKAKITLFPNANHNSWDPAFAEPKFLKWMFSKKK